MQTIGDRAKARRAELGMSQAEVARRVGGSTKQAHIGQLELNETRYPKYLTGLARALNVSREWLEFGTGDKERAERDFTPVVGYIGAGEEVYPIDDYEKGAGIDDLPLISGLEDCVAVRVRGDSMRPAFRPGDALYFRQEYGQPPVLLIGAECVVKVKDGGTFVKTLRPGRRKGCFDLYSYNAEPMLDQPVEWAAKVEFIKRGS